MANPARGELSFEAIGEKWTFIFGMNAICAAEEDFDQPFVEIIGQILPGAGADLVDNPAAAAEAAKRMRFSNVRKMLRFGLIEHHPDVDDLEVGTIIDSIGLADAIDILGRGLALALGGDEDEGAAANPRRPRPKR